MVMVHGFRGDHHGLALLADCLPDTEIYLPELPGSVTPPPSRTPSTPSPITPPPCATRYRPWAWSRCPPPGAGPRPRRRRRPGPSCSAIPSVRSSPRTWPRSNPHTGGSWSSSIRSASRPCPPTVHPLNGLGPSAQGYYAAPAALPEALGMALLSSPVVVWFTGTVMAKTEDRQTLAYLHDQHQSYFSAFDHRRVLVESYRASIRGTVLDVADRLEPPACSSRAPRTNWNPWPARNTWPAASVRSRPGLDWRCSTTSAPHPLRTGPGGGRLDPGLPARSLARGTGRLHPFQPADPVHRIGLRGGGLDAAQRLDQPGQVIGLIQKGGSRRRRRRV